MKKFNLIVALLLLIVSISLAQTPEQFKYQAVLHDASGNIIVNQSKTVIINILQDSATGTSVFTEIHNVTTTAQGLINLNIGSQNPLTNLDWSSNVYFIKITVDNVVMGTSQLMSVPYALHAKTVKNETDPIFITSPAFGVTSTNLANWNTAYSWGNHATSGYLTAETAIWKRYDSKNIYFSGFAVIGTNSANKGVPLYLYSDTIGLVNSVFYQRVNGSTALVSSMLNMQRDTSVIGYGVGISYRLSNINNASTEYGYLGSIIEDNTLGAEKGGLVFAVRDNGNHRQQKMRLSSNGNLGIGTSTPKSKLHVSNGDVYIDNIGSGIIMKDNLGQCWRITINSSGILQPTLIPCPENGKSVNSLQPPNNNVNQKGNEE